jgi:L-iditol 2-dehydrogenase
MKAQVYRGAQQLCFEDIERPTLQAGDVLVRVVATGIAPQDINHCAAPMGEWPRIFGREIVGTIAECGEGCEGWTEGQRVAVRSRVPCLRCDDCVNERFSACSGYRSQITTAGFIPSGGGFAEFVRVPKYLVELGGLWAIPSSVSWEQALFLDPVQRCLGAIARANLKPGQLVWILGAGSLGSILMLILHRFGIRTVITDMNPDRLDRARDLNAGTVIPSVYDDLHTKIQSFTHSKGADAAIITIPTQHCLHHAIDGTRRGGQILLLCDDPFDRMQSIDPCLFSRRELNLTAGFTLAVRQRSLAEELICDRRMPLEHTISHRYSLEELPFAIDRASAETPDTVKLVVYSQTP